MQIHDAFGKLIEVNPDGSHPTFTIFDNTGKLIIIPANSGASGGSGSGAQAYLLSADNYDISQRPSGSIYYALNSPVKNVNIPAGLADGTIYTIVGTERRTYDITFTSLGGETIGAHKPNIPVMSRDANSVVRLIKVNGAWLVDGDVLYAPARHPWDHYEYRMCQGLPTAAYWVLSGLELYQSMSQVAQIATPSIWANSLTKLAKYKASGVFFNATEYAWKLNDGSVTTNAAVAAASFGYGYTLPVSIDAAPSITMSIKTSVNKNLATAGMLRMVCNNDSFHWYANTAFRLYGYDNANDKHVLLNVPCIEYTASAGKVLDYPIGGRQWALFPQSGASVSGYVQLAELTFKRADGTSIMAAETNSATNYVNARMICSNYPRARSGITVTGNHINSLIDGNAATFSELILYDPAFWGVVHSDPAIEVTSVTMTASQTAALAPFTGDICYSDDGGVSWIKSWSFAKAWTAGETFTTNKP